MMIRYQLTHRTQYKYAEDVSLCHNQVMMTPKSTNSQTCLHNTLVIKPYPSTLEYRKDYFGNQVVYFALDKPHDELSISSECIVEVNETQSRQLENSLPWNVVRDQINEGLLGHQLVDYTLPTRFTLPQSEGLPIIQNIFTPDKPILQAAAELSRYIKNEFKFDNKATHILTPLSKVIRTKRGVCQDFTHLCLSLLRFLKLPVRYVSGYIETIAPPGQKKLRGVDASHAWISVYCPQNGWVDFDPTNGQMRNEHYIETAIGRDYSDIAPLKGIIFGGGKNKMTVSVDVHRL